NFKDVLNEARRLSPSAQLVGCTGDGVIGIEGHNESMKALAIMAIKGHKDEFAVAGQDRITNSTSFEVAAKLARDLKEMNPKISMIHFLPSGFDVAADLALEGIESVFGTEIPIFGASSGDNMKFISNFQFIGDKIIEKGAVAVGFADPTLEVITQSTHGFNIIGDPFEVTRSELNRISEIEGQPAWKFLANRMGVPGAEDLTELVVVILGQELPEELHDEYGNTHTLLAVLGKDEDGSILLAAVCPPGTKLCLAVRDEERMFADLDKMVEQLIKRCKGRKPYAVFHADCAARGRWSFNRVLKDEIVRRMQFPLIQDSNVPWLGIYGFGEFSELGGRNRFHMFTTSLFVILKKQE
ncbi:MAG: FIST C-terminal domain-containing protein, partial [Desulfobacterales bacterium]